MKYYSVEEARGMDGIKLALAHETPNAFCEAVKTFLDLKGLSYTPVSQYPGEENQALLDWTGRRNAPVLVINDEPALDRWLDILIRLDRLVPEPPLLPQDSKQRAETVGIISEIAGEEGLGWVRRVFSLNLIADESPNMLRLTSIYRVTPETVAKAPARIADVFGMLAEKLKEQRAKGSPYLVGDKMTAADIYWAQFSTAFEPLGDDLYPPMPDWLKDFFKSSTPEIDAAKDPILFEHRDMMFEKYIKTPLDF